MDRTSDIREESAMLMRIVALLFALADLAEAACLRSRATCSLVLWLLRPAEAAVLTLLDVPPGFPDGLPPPPAAQCADSRVGLMSLALRFRELACFLKCQADLVIPAAGSHGELRDRCPSLVASLLDIVSTTALSGFVRPTAAPDTS
jgi:hypothetical protein